VGRRIVMLIAVLAVALAAAAVATAGNGGRPLSATLTGAAEVPGPGDSDASGEAFLRLNQGQERICFTVSWADIDGTVLVGHIHPGAAGEVNPPLVDLFFGPLPGTGSASGCSQDPDIDRGLIKAIRKHPSDYYVNVHSTEFEAGAVRGQLSK
jgi:CHRD domain